jgi:predicted ABC-type ATPase
MTAPGALILAGPNGAGKTTVSTALVPAGTEFLNSDVIAARLVEQGHPPRGVEVAAGRQLLGRLRDLVAAGEPFCIETNLAGRGLLRWIEEWHARGYVVGLAFIALDSPELALERVATRVALGGHDVPDDVVRRRWAAGLRLFFGVYVTVVDEWVLFDNSGQSLRRVAEGTRDDAAPRIGDRQRWALLRSLPV